jgi:hypothetical protein
MRPVRIVLLTPPRRASAWRFNLRCLVFGHEDQVRCVPGRLYLKCHECGRETTGWHVGKKGRQRKPSSSVTQDLVIRAQVLR